MPNNTHTPGPWRVGDAGATVFGPPNGSPSPETIATVRKRDNATLIAAAPELLAALRELIGWVPMTVNPDARTQRSKIAALEAASAAIARAEGR